LLVGQDIGIPESQYLITVRGECGVAHAVSDIIRVLSAINFDNESFLATNEIHDIWSDGFLANEFETTQVSVT